MDVMNVKCKDFSPTFDKRDCKYYQESTPSTCGFCKLPNNYRCLEDARDWKKPIPLSYSSVSDFLTCHRLYYLKAVKGIQTRSTHVSTPLKLGTLWDRVQQRFFGSNVEIDDIIQEYEIPDRDVARVKGLYRAFRTLDMKFEEGGDTQAKIDLKLEFEDKCWGNGNPVVLPITGYYDRKYPDSFVEQKLTTRPDNYQDIWFIQSQVGTYFLADESLQSCVMEVTRLPDLKTTAKMQDESPEEYMQRVFKDVMARPSHYFIGYDKVKKTYGKRFYRKEFNLDEIAARYKAVFREIYEAHMLDGFYCNDRVCKSILPGIPCDYINICRYGVMSEEVFKIRDIPF